MKLLKYIYILLCLLCINVASASHSIVFVHIGSALPNYANVAFSQAKLFNPNCPIFILAKGTVLQKLEQENKLNGYTGINYEDLIMTPEHKQFIENDARTDNFWRYTSERFLYLYDFITQYNLKDVFHLEYDNMLYIDLETLLPVFQKHYPGIGATFDNDIRCIPGFVYLSNPNAAQKLANCFMRHVSNRLNDMQIIALFKQESPSLIDHLPIITPQYIQDHPLISPMNHIPCDKSKYMQNIDLFLSIFDAAALGQFLGGTDTIHAGGGIPGFINESCVFNPSLLSYEWIADEKGRLIPYAIYDHTKFRINNLHIHSKNLVSFHSLRSRIFP